MEIIKVNYNNIYVAKPGMVSPYFFSYRKFGTSTDNLIFIVVADPLESDPYYINYNLEVYVNGIAVAYLDRNSDRRLVIDNPDLYNQENITVTIKGYYRDEYNKYYFPDITKQINILPYCSENIPCSPSVVVNNMYIGYLRHNNRFYLTQLDDNIYTDEIINKDDSLYFDLPSNTLYKYLTSQQKFVRV